MGTQLLAPCGFGKVLSSCCICSAFCRPTLRHKHNWTAITCTSWSAFTTPFLPVEQPLPITPRGVSRCFPIHADLGITALRGRSALNCDTAARGVDSGQANQVKRAKSAFSVCSNIISKQSIWEWNYAQTKSLLSPPPPSSHAYARLSSPPTHLPTSVGRPLHSMWRCPQTWRCRGDVWSNHLVVESFKTPWLPKSKTGAYYC